MIELQCYNTWQVTTEGDCEGRSIRHLGVHVGNIDDIAFALASQAYYGLRFELVEPTVVSEYEPTGTKIEVSIDVKSGTWDMNKNDRIAYFKRMLRGRDVTVKSGTYYSCVTLISNSSLEAQADAKKQILKKAALAKLSLEERKALGV